MLYFTHLILSAASEECPSAGVEALVMQTITDLDTTPATCATDTPDQIFMSNLRKPSDEAKRQGSIQSLYEKVLAEAQLRIQICLSNGQYSQANVSSSDVPQIVADKICATKSCQVPSITCGFISPYYTSDGTCNYRTTPSRGSTATPLRRLTQGNESSTSDIPSHSVTLTGNASYSKMILLWKQFIDHDLFLLPEMEGECEGYRKSSPALTLTSGTKRQQINDVTSYLDGSTIYGTSASQTNALRTMVNGTLKTGTNDSLPLDTSMGSSVACPPAGEMRDCYLAGDRRVNENEALTALHTVWVREHNRIAAKLHKRQPMWDDERLFQETRKVVVAMIQKITYEDYLKALLGERAYNVTLGGYSDYQGSTDSTIPNVYTTLDIPFPAGPVPSSRLNVDATLSQTLMALGTVNISADRATLNIQRQRDHATPTYGEWKSYCRTRYLFLPQTNIRADLVQSLVDTYGSVDNADLWAAAMAEETLLGGLVGSTLACIIGKTFSDLRQGDRLFYSRPGAFTQSQRREINKISLSQVILSNTGIESIQCNPFLVASGNATGCTSLKPFKLKAWKNTQCFYSVIKDPATVGNIRLIATMFGRNTTLGNSPQCFRSSCDLDTSVYLWTDTPQYFDLSTDDTFCAFKVNSLLLSVALVVEPCETCPREPSPDGPGKLGGIAIDVPRARRYADQNYGVYSTRAGCRDGSIAAFRGRYPTVLTGFVPGCFTFDP